MTEDGMESMGGVLWWRGTLNVGGVLHHSMSVLYTHVIQLQSKVGAIANTCRKNNDNRNLYVFALHVTVLKYLILSGAK